jgi:hypothetical protein
VSTLRVDALQNRSGGDLVNAKGMARAWVNFNGTGTVAIRASGNVSSVAKNATGRFVVNLATAMPDANYSASAITVRGNNENEDFPTTVGIGRSMTASQLPLFIRNIVASAL